MSFCAPGEWWHEGHQAEGIQRKIPSFGHLKEGDVLDRMAWRFPRRNGNRTESTLIPFPGLDGGVCDRRWVERSDPDNPGLNS